MNRNLLILFCALFVVIMAYNGYEARKKMQFPIAKQNEVTDELIRWKQAYRSLEPIEDQWNETFASLKNVDDMVSLVEKVDFEKSFIDLPTEDLRVIQANQVSVHDKMLDLVKIYIGDRNTTDGVKFNVADINELLKIITNIDKRIDADVSKLVLERRGHKVRVELSGLAFMLRS